MTITLDQVKNWLGTDKTAIAIRDGDLDWIFGKLQAEVANTVWPESLLKSQANMYYESAPNAYKHFQAVVTPPTPGPVVQKYTVDNVPTYLSDEQLAFLATDGLKYVKQFISNQLTSAKVVLTENIFSKLVQLGFNEYVVKSQSQPEIVKQVVENTVVKPAVEPVVTPVIIPTVIPVEPPAPKIVETQTFTSSSDQVVNVRPDLNDPAIKWTITKIDNGYLYVGIRTV